jgi:thiol:disulfide interchange protein DsbA
MRKYLTILLVALFATSSCSAEDKPGAAPAPAAKQWQEGQDYFLVQPPQPTSSDGKVEVLEVFSYACPHCAHFQPYVEELKSKLPANARFELMPAIFQAGWEPFARAFYTAKSLGVLDKTHQALFDAVHRDHQPLRTLDDLATLFYANYGVNPGNFQSTATSFVIEGELQHAMQQVRAYGVDATPTLIVNGKYRVTGNADRGIGFPEMVQITLDLTAKEAAAAKKGK